MRFFPRNRKSRHDALVGPEHVARHPRADALTERDRIARYSRGNGAVVAGTATFNESDVVHAAVAAGGTLTLTPGTIANDKVTIGTTVYVFAADPTTDASAAGTSGHPWQVLVGGTNTLSLANLRKAINATGVAGTDYSAALTIHPTVTASSSDATTCVVAAKTPGTAGNAIVTTRTIVTTDDGLAWGGATLSGGYDAVVLALTVTGDDLWQADVITARSVQLILSFPTTDGLRAALSAGNFSLSADCSVLTLTLPSIGAYSISADAHYDVTLAKTLLRLANDTIVVASAINIVSGA